MTLESVPLWVEYALPSGRELAVGVCASGQFVRDAAKRLGGADPGLRRQINARIFDHALRTALRAEAEEAERCGER